MADSTEERRSACLNQWRESLAEHRRQDDEFTSCRVMGIDIIRQHLGEEWVEAILDIALVIMPFRFLATGQVAGRERTVVLLGESHIKSEREAERGQALLAQFPFRGIEGIRANTALGNLLNIPNKLMLDTVYTAAGYYYGRSKGSTIREAINSGAVISADEPSQAAVTNVLLESGSYDALTVAQSYLMSATGLNLLLSPALLGVDGYLLYKDAG